MVSLAMYFYSGSILYDCRCLESVWLFTGSSTIKDNLLFKTDNILQEILRIDQSLISLHVASTFK